MQQEKLIAELDDLLASLNATERELKEAIPAALRDGELLRDACREIGESASGSWVGWHARMYYRDFKEPPVEASWNTEWGGVYGYAEGWRESSVGEIQQEAEGRAGISLSELATAADGIRERCEPLRGEVLTVLSPICDLTGLDKEADLLAKIEAIEWIVPPAKFIEAIRPAQIWSRDSHAVSQGMQVPLHLNVETAVVSNTSTVATCRDFLANALRVSRQARTKLAAQPRTPFAAPAEANDDLRTRLRRQSIALFSLLAIVTVASLVWVLRSFDFSTFMQALLLVAGATVVASLYALFLDRARATRAIAVAAGAAGTIAAVDQILGTLK